jgi:hypothetical protein
MNLTNRLKKIEENFGASDSNFCNCTEYSRYETYTQNGPNAPAVNDRNEVLMPLPDRCKKCGKKRDVTPIVIEIVPSNIQSDEVYTFNLKTTRN